MSPKTAPHIDIVRLEDKETKLKSFIKTFIDETAASATAGADRGVLLLVVRSLDSPVAKAVSALVQDGVLDMPIRAVFAMIERHDISGGQPKSEPFCAVNAASMARDPRLLDVHEQLVLGPSTSWIGDCMRRDPRKRDAYECYAANCSETARWARISFERLWEKSQAVVLPGVTEIANMAATDACAGLPGEAPAAGHETSTAG